jgi:hypothetical protein
VKLIEILKVALAAIWSHKLRSALTLLGMIVGVTAVRYRRLAHPGL